MCVVISVLTCMCVVISVLTCVSVIMSVLSLLKLSVSIEDAKVVHKCLKQAAGLFLYLKVCVYSYYNVIYYWHLCVHSYISYVIMTLYCYLCTVYMCILLL